MKNALKTCNSCNQMRIIIALNEVTLLTSNNLNIAINHADAFAVILDQLAIGKLLIKTNVELALNHPFPASLGVALALLQRGKMLTQETALMCLVAPDPFQLAKKYVEYKQLPKPLLSIFSPEISLPNFIKYVYENNVSFFTRHKLDLKFDDCNTLNDAVKKIQEKLNSIDEKKDPNMHQAIVRALNQLGQSVNQHPPHPDPNAAPPARHS